MDEETIINCEKVAKTYKLFDSPAERVKETFHPFRKKYHRPFYALNDISLQVKRGETIGIIGHNGSGKSTLLQIICGISQPSSGTVEVNGKISGILELGTGFNPEFTGRQNVYFYGAILGFKPEEIDVRLDDIINFADIGRFIDQPVKTYSSGMYVRLAFAVAINVDPDILVIDEVLAVGDLRFQMKCINKLRTLQEEEKTILFVTHAIELTKRFCTKSIWIEKGRIRMSGDTNVVGDAFIDYMHREPALDSRQHLLETNSEDKVFYPAKITRAEILDNEERATSIFKKGDDIRLKIAFEIIDEHIENLLLGVALFDRKHTYVYGPNTYLDNFTIPSSNGYHEILYTLKSVPLLGGSYYIDVGLFTSYGMVCLDYQSRIAKFEIQTDYLAEGLCELDHEWELLK